MPDAYLPCPAISHRAGSGFSIDIKDNRVRMSFGRIKLRGINAPAIKLEVFREGDFKEFNGRQRQVHFFFG